MRMLCLLVFKTGRVKMMLHLLFWLKFCFEHYEGNGAHGVMAMV